MAGMGRLQDGRLSTGKVPDVALLKKKMRIREREGF